MSAETFDVFASANYAVFVPKQGSMLYDAWGMSHQGWDNLRAQPPLAKLMPGLALSTNLRHHQLRDNVGGVSSSVAGIPASWNGLAVAVVIDAHCAVGLPTNRPAFIPSLAVALAPYATEAMASEQALQEMAKREHAREGLRLETAHGADLDRLAETYKLHRQSNTETDAAFRRRVMNMTGRFGAFGR